MIKIQNIYYMLAYAFQVLNEEGYRNIASENFEYADDLLAAILAKGIANQIKRGLGREYVSKSDTVNSPHGKINISASLKTRTILKKQLICDFDEFSENAYINQILKTCILILIKSHTVSQDQKRNLKKILSFFDIVSTLNPNNIQWSRINYHRNNSTYKMLMHICYLIFEALLLTTKDGFRKLSQFKDDHLYQLFERFVLEYYKKHYPYFKVSGAKIDWNLDDSYNKFLPVMKSDITLEHNKKILIIDTKYYSRTMQTNNLYNSQTIHSNNLYQIFTYVKNKDIDHTGNVSGILLYAKTDEVLTPDYSYLMGGNKISVKTLDLDINFNEIRKQLDNIINEWQLQL